MNTDSVDWEKYKENIAGISQVTFVDDHVGGCNIYGDPACECPKMWKYLANTLGVRSVVDVGCGFGFHTKYFKEILGCDVLGVEGSSKVVDICLLPNDIVCHDYNNGSYVPKKTYDMCWCIEFVEHVEEKYRENFIETFKKCKYLAMTHGLPGQGGYHHVNCQPPEYWIDLLRIHGFVLLNDLTFISRQISQIDCNDYVKWRADLSPDKPYRGPSAQANDFRKNDNLVPWFALNGLIFLNTNLI
jgi:SAM-dependent methyltransferase